MILYRSPDILIGDCEWHIRVIRKRDGRSTRFLKWRPLAANRHAWTCVSEWPGNKPKHNELQRLNIFRKHAAMAERSEAERLAKAGGKVVRR